MKNIIVTTLVFLALKLNKALPNGKGWHFCRKDYNGRKRPMKDWTLVCFGEPDGNGDYAMHVISKSGIWDSNKRSYVDMAGRGIKY